MTPLVSMVVARADNGVIGRGGGLPWHIPEDLKHFKRVTMGKPIVMGRATFESIGRALPGRLNIVLTRDTGWRAAGVEVAQDWPAVLTAAGPVPELCLIGGAQIFAAHMPQTRRAYLTEVHAEPEGDTWMPALTVGWREVERNDLAATTERPAISFVTLERMALPEPT